jgi:L-threonylcarbamoyladenylate synthase
MFGKWPGTWNENRPVWMPQVLEIDPLQPQDALIGRAVRVLRAGGVVAFPTETFYGLAADAMNDEAIEQIFRIKGRAFSNPIALISGSKNDLGGCVGEIPASAKGLMQAFWPGPLTLLFAASPRISPRLTAGSGKIGIRVSSHPVADSLANLACLGGLVDLVIEGGATPGGTGSTIFDVTKFPPVCLRDGAIPAARVFEIITKNTKF